jgi:hypothetical protein
MAAEDAPRDGNFVPAALFQIDGAARGQLMAGRIDEATGRVLVDSATTVEMAIGDTVTGGTTGSVLFIGAGPVLAQDNANFFWDDTNNYLGIGTNSPDVPLHIGSGTPATPDSTIAMVRSLSGAGNGHGISDETAINITGAYNSFDARPTITGLSSAAGGHYAGFQFRPSLAQGTLVEQVRGYHVSGATELSNGTTVTDYFSFLSTAPTVTSGSITNLYHFYGTAPSGVTNYYGLYLSGSPTNLMGGGFTGYGTTTPTARIHLAGSLSSTAWTTGGIAVRQQAGTYTDTSSSGTVTATYINSFGGGAIAASSATTYTTAATFAVPIAPTVGTNVTITNPLAIYSVGNNVFAGFNVFGNLGSTPAAAVQIATNRSSTSWTTAGILLSVGGQTLTDTDGTGTIATRVGSSITRPTFASTNAVTVTDGASFYISNAPAAGTNTSITNAYAFFVDAGNVRLDGDVVIGGSGTPVSNLEVTNATGGIITARRVDTSVTANDMVGKLQFYAADTSTTSNFIVANIEAQATNTVTTDINPGRLIFRTTPTGVAATPTEAMRIDETQVLNVCSTVATPAAGSTAARLLFGTTAGFGIYYGSGAPTVSAAKGSLYMRSDGTTTNDRMYVNTNGSTTWTAVTTVA